MKIDQVKQEVPTQIPADDVWPAVLHKQHARLSHLIVRNESGERTVSKLRTAPMLDVFVSL